MDLRIVFAIILILWFLGLILLVGAIVDWRRRAGRRGSIEPESLAPRRVAFLQDYWRTAIGGLGTLSVGVGISVGTGLWIVPGTATVGQWITMASVVIGTIFLVIVVFKANQQPRVTYRDLRSELDRALKSGSSRDWAPPRFAAYLTESERRHCNDLRTGSLSIVKRRNTDLIQLAKVANVRERYRTIRKSARPKDIASFLLWPGSKGLPLQLFTLLSFSITVGWMIIIIDSPSNHRVWIVAVIFVLCSVIIVNFAARALLSALAVSVADMEADRDDCRQILSYLYHRRLRKLTTRRRRFRH